jgi:xylulokinase
MINQYVLTIDVGTTNCKTLLIDNKGDIAARVSYEYPVAGPKPGWSEQDPEVWWTTVKRSIREIVSRVDSKAIEAVGLSGQMHGLVILDNGGNVLRPAILWNDQRSAPQCEEVYELVGGKDGLLKYTNNPMLPGYTGGKLLWVREHEPKIYGQTAKFFLPKDYIRYRLTGDIATDVSDASGTGLFNVKQRRWAYDLIDLLGLSGDWFPKVRESSDFVGSIGSVVASETGLNPATPVTTGGGDAVMQTVGGGATNSDVALIVIGTGGNVTVSVPHCIENPAATLQIFCHVLPEQWVAMGVTLSAGNSLKWFRDTLGGLEMAVAAHLETDPYEILGQEAARSPLGSRGLLFLPYLQGERCPYPDASARGSFVGLGLYTKKADMVRSVMEGVTFSLRDVLELILQAGVNPSRIHSSGGGSASPLWRQIQADIFNRVVTTLDHSEDASAVGAGVVAGVKAGFWPSVEEAVEVIKARTVDQPIRENVEKYNALFLTYKNLYPALKPSFDELAAQLGES